MISIWEKETFFAPQDVIIVGSGLAGLWSAHYLKKKNKKLRITIIDRGIIPTGSSTRNAGFACFGSLTELLADEQSMGTDKMLELVEMRFKGLKRIQKTFPDKQIDFNLCGGYELFTEKEAYMEENLKEQVDYLNKLLKSTIKNKKTFSIKNGHESFGFKGVTNIVRNKLEGQLHSGKLTKALLSELQTNDVQVLNGLEAERFEKINDKIELHTHQHIGLTCSQLLICNNGLTKQLLPGIQTDLSRGQVLVTSEIENLKWKGTFHYDEGFYYFRNLGKKILLGGARNKAITEEKTASLETSLFLQNELERFLKEIILPGYHYKIEHRWSGTMGMGKNKMPDVTKVSPNVFCAVNLGGMGVALAPIIGEQVATMMNEEGS